MNSVQPLIRRLVMRIAIVIPCLLVLASIGLWRVHANPPAAGNGIIVFGPHPDDAELGCSAVIQQAKERGEPVHVVILTNGDSDIPAAAGIVNKREKDLGPDDFLAISRSRQEQSQQGVAALGLKPDALILLGYPNDGLVDMYHGTGSAAYTSPFTQRSATYALAQKDYHTAAHGSPAPYTRQAMLDDIGEIIQTYKPRTIYVTDQADGHPDHSIAFFYVREAIQKTGYSGEFYTYLVHAAGGYDWPWPWGVTPNQSFEPPHPRKSGQEFPIPWPPDKQVVVTAAQNHAKLLAIRCHKLKMLDPKVDFHHEDYMESFVKSDEVFWVPSQK